MGVSMINKIKALTLASILVISVTAKSACVLHNIKKYCLSIYSNYIDISTCESSQLEQYLTDHNTMHILTDQLYEAILLKKHVPKENVTALLNSPLFVEMFVDRCGICHEAWPIIDLIKDDTIVAKKFITPVLKQIHMTVINAREGKSIQFQSQVHPNLLMEIIKCHPNATAHFLCPSIELFCALYSDGEFYPQAQDWMKILLQVIDATPGGFNVLTELLIAHNALYHDICDMLVQYKPAIKESLIKEFFPEKVSELNQ